MSLAKRLSALREGARRLTVLLSQMVGTLLRHRVTLDFPFGPPEIAQGYRGRIAIDPDRCRGCSLCVRDCPAFALEIQREDKNVFQLIYYPERCAFCGQCEASCTFGAITQTNEFVRGTGDPGSLHEVLVNRGPEADDERVS